MCSSDLTVIASVLLFWVEDLLGEPVLTLSPVLALLAGLVFFAKAGILSGAFYIQACVLFATSLAMCLVPAYQHILFGLVSAACFFVPGYKYHRQRTTAAAGAWHGGVRPCSRSANPGSTPPVAR